MNRLADFIDHHRWLLTLVIILGALIALIGITRLELAVDLNFLLDRESPEFNILNRMNEEFGSESDDCLLVIQGRDVFHPEFIKTLRQTIEQISQVPGIESIFSIDDIPVFNREVPVPLLPRKLHDPNLLEQARQNALGHPLVIGHLLSPDFGTTIVIVRLNKDALDINQCMQAVDSIREVTHRTSTESDLKIQMTGSPPFRVDMLRFMHRENINLFVIPFLVGFTIALILFRRLSAVLMVGMPPFIGVLLTMGASGWLGAEWTVIGMAIPTMVFVVGLTDAVHLVLHMRRKVNQESFTPRAAALSAVREIGWACALTSLTTAIGFGSLVLAGSSAVRNLGLFCALGTLITFFIVIILIPILAATPLGNLATKKSLITRADRGIAGLGYVIDYIISRSKQFAIGSTVLTLLLASCVLILEIDTSEDWIPMEEESVQAYFAFNEAFTGGVIMNILIEWPDSPEELPAQVFGALEDIHKLFDNDPVVSYPLSALNLVRCAPASLRKLDRAAVLIRTMPQNLTKSFIRLDHRCAMVTARYNSINAAGVLKIHARYEQEMKNLAQKYPQLAIHVTGESYIASRMVYRIIHELGMSISLAAFIITIVMLAAFKSWRYGPICLIPNIFPLAVICALILLIHKPLNVANVLLFTICLGIAVDDTIHFITRYRRELRAGFAPAQAARRSFDVVGKAIITTTLIFIFGFGALITSSLEGYHNFAFLACAGFVAALMGDLFILPALLIRLGPNERK